MAMYEEQQQQQQQGNFGDQIRSRVQQQRRQVEHLAEQLSQQSIQQWQKAIEGFVALPAAIVVGFAATTLYAVGFVTRGFEVFEQEAAEGQRQMRNLGRDEREALQGRDAREGQRRRGDEQTPSQENVPRA